MILFVDKYKYIILTCLMFVSIVFSSQIANSNKLPGKDYFTDDLGNVYMHINILGHVNRPGTYMIYEGADIYTILSQAGGTLRGAKLKNIKIYDGDNPVRIINLNDHIHNNINSNFKINPNSTIYVEETTISFLLYGTNIASTLLNILSIYLNLTD